jgi:hypothetical protein
VSVVVYRTLSAMRPSHGYVGKGAHVSCHWTPLAGSRVGNLRDDAIGGTAAQSFIFLVDRGSTNNVGDPTARADGQLGDLRSNDAQQLLNI